MKIQTLIHGEPSDPTLFALIGPVALSRSVHRDLGAPITSEPGRHWAVAVEAGEAIGFASLHLLADGHRAKMHHLWVADQRNALSVRRRLVQAIEKRAVAYARDHLATVDRDTSRRFYENLNWTADGQRGQFITYERDLTDD